MKGDLSTVKKISRYASTVMTAGGVALALGLISLLSIGILSLTSDVANELLHEILDAKDSLAAAFIQLLTILGLGLVTVLTVKRLMMSIVQDHSPFNEYNSGRLKMLSITYLASSPALAITDITNSGLGIHTLFLFFGTLLVCVVMYCLSCIFNYGSALQKESDETL